MCSVCTDNWAYSTGIRCEVCETGDAAKQALAKRITLMVVLPLLLFALLRWVFSRDRSKKAEAALALHASVMWWRGVAVPLKILVTFAQVLSQLHYVYVIPYPESFERFLQRMAFVNLNLIDLLQVGCVARVDYHGKIFIVTLVPVAISIVLLQVALSKPTAAVKKACTKIFLLLTFAVFPGVSTMVLRVFPCQSFEDGSSRLKADYSISCNAPGRPYYVAYAVVMVIVYPIGITALYAKLLWGNRQLICPKSPTDQREWTKLCGVEVYPPPPLSIAEDDKRLVARDEMLREDKKDDTNAMLLSTQFLFKEYKPRFWWFEIFECVRRFMLTGGTVLFFEGSATQVASGMLISIVTIYVYANTRPYINRRDDFLAIAAQWGIFFTLFAGLLLKTNVPSDDGYDAELGSVLILANVSVFVIAVGTVFIFIWYRNQRDRARERALLASYVPPKDVDPGSKGAQEQLLGIEEELNDADLGIGNAEGNLATCFKSIKEVLESVVATASLEQLEAVARLAGTEHKAAYAACYDILSKDVGHTRLLEDAATAAAATAAGHPHQAVGNLFALQTQARLVLPGFRSCMKGIVATFKGRKTAKGTDAVKLALSPPKKLYRCCEKMCLKPGGKRFTATNVCDVVRCIISCNDCGLMSEVLGTLQACRGVKIVRVKDRANNMTSMNWMDVMVNLTLVSDTYEHVCEVQVVHAKMLVARSELGGHGPYGKLRAATEILALRASQVQVKHRYRKGGSGAARGGCGGSGQAKRNAALHVPVENPIIVQEAAGAKEKQVLYA
jgi:hypothetical protein